jgi:hypothetical protein
VPLEGHSHGSSAGACGSRRVVGWPSDQDGRSALALAWTEVDELNGVVNELARRLAANPSAELLDIVAELRNLLLGLVRRLDEAIESAGSQHIPPAPRSSSETRYASERETRRCGG